MKIAINLASKPYQNLRPYYTAACIAAVSLMILALVLAGEERQEREETSSLTRQINRLEKELKDLSGEQQQLEEWLKKPEVREIRDRSAFLNSLILRKSISWTQMFLDVEKILPPKAQVTSIRPGLSRSQQPELNLSVTAAEMGTLVELLKNLESSPQFGSPVVDSQRMVTEKGGEGHIILVMSTPYRPAVPAPAPVQEAEPSKEPNPAALATAAVAQQKGNR